MAGETGGEIAVPPTLQALLATRLDQLETAERSVLERGAIEGEIFHRGAVQALAPDESQVTPHLASLVRKGLIRPDKPQLAGEDGFRFRHLLIRDAAYDALPKATRADLHQRFAAWLEDTGSELVELDELLGYHLEQACSYRAELGLPGDDELAAAARRRLTAGGQRAARRQDYGAAVSLLERAAALVPADRARPRSRDRAQRRPVLVGQGRRGAPARRRPRRAGLRGGRSSRRALREDPGGRVRSPRAGRRDGEAGRTRRAGAACAREPPATTWLCTSDTPRSGELAELRGRPGRSAGGVRASLRPRRTGRPPTVVDVGLARLVSVRRHDPCFGVARLARRDRPRAGAGSVPPCLPGLVARQARSFRRGARDPRRSARATARSAAGESCSRTSPHSSPSGSSSWPAIPPPQPSSERKDAGCTRSSGRQGFLARGVREPCAAPTRSTGSRRPRPGRARGGAGCERRPWAQSALAAGKGEGARASRRARRSAAARA